ncbi:hypothetical protein D7I43_28395 [Micromonospora globbae]|uniref:Uncharacterized protein n=1 Tax=Micromonospora globbae TaxID=1894969 RepID=A0A420ETQ3_9ACTN|nr:hypothetical protein D7I43_28395 [Micromonospora globbae]
MRRFGPTCSALLATNRRPSWVSSPGRSTPPASSRTFRPSIPAQNCARRAGSCASKATANCREIITAP